ncbi:thiamine phosphate synthase [Nitrosomonas sp. Is79A3]|uniref:thiamine phosphate synthase n=1 Tax=Nitrosomonas sp. (strain Is79A3) TaxID=261292 RepID=UPI0003109185
MYAITPELENTGGLLDKTRQVLEGGAQLIQYRNKSANRILLKEQAGLLLQLCREYTVPLIINDYLDLTIEIGADGLHVGQHDAAIAKARNQLGDDKIIGASCYNNLNLALQAEKEGVDYVAFGAFFPSLTKPNTVSVTMNLIAEAKNKITVPIVGIGGIRLTNAKKVIQSGCAAIAVCNDLFQSVNIKAKAAQYAQLFAETN